LAGVAAPPGAVGDPAVARLCQDTIDIYRGKSGTTPGGVKAFNCEDSGRDGVDGDLLYSVPAAIAVRQQLAVHIQAHPVITHGFDHNCLKRRVAVQIKVCTLGSFYIC
jgi:hypothetical protein